MRLRWKKREGRVTFQRCQMLVVREGFDLLSTSDGE